MWLKCQGRPRIVQGGTKSWRQCLHKSFLEDNSQGAQREQVSCPALSDLQSDIRLCCGGRGLSVRLGLKKAGAETHLESPLVPLSAVLVWGSWGPLTPGHSGSPKTRAFTETRLGPHLPSAGRRSACRAFPAGLLCICQRLLFRLVLWDQSLAVAVTPVVLPVTFQPPPAETSSVWDRQPSPHKLPAAGCLGNAQNPSASWAGLQGRAVVGCSAPLWTPFALRLTASVTASAENILDSLPGSLMILRRLQAGVGEGVEASIRVELLLEGAAAGMLEPWLGPWGSWGLQGAGESWWHPVRSCQRSRAPGQEKEVLARGDGSGPYTRVFSWFSAG